MNKAYAPCAMAILNTERTVIIANGLNSKTLNKKQVYQNQKVMTSLGKLIFGGDTVDINDFAKKLDGRSYGLEMIGLEEKEAEELGLVVVFGYSDDNAEFRGAIDEEVGCWNGKDILLDKDGLIENCECGCKYFKEAANKARVIKAVWHDEGECAWTYETDIPHAIFTIWEDRDMYCKGIVFDLKNLGGEVNE